MNKVTENGCFIEPEEAAADMEIIADLFIDVLSRPDCEYTSEYKERIRMAWIHVRALMAPLQTEDLCVR